MLKPHSNSQNLRSFRSSAVIFGKTDTQTICNIVHISIPKNHTFAILFTSLHNAHVHSMVLCTLLLLIHLISFLSFFLFCSTYGLCSENEPFCTLRDTHTYTLTQPDTEKCTTDYYRKFGNIIRKSGKRTIGFYSRIALLCNVLRQPGQLIKREERSTASTNTQQHELV